MRARRSRAKDRIRYHIIFSEKARETFFSYPLSVRDELDMDLGDIAERPFRLSFAEDLYAAYVPVEGSKYSGFRIDYSIYPDASPPSVVIHRFKLLKL